jgi:hypothetical protein
MFEIDRQRMVIYCVHCGSRQSNTYTAKPALFLLSCDAAHNVGTNISGDFVPFLANTQDSHFLTLIPAAFPSHPSYSITSITFRKVVPVLNPLKTEFLLNNIYKSSPYLTGNTLRLHYKAQPVNAAWGNSRCLF